MLTTSGDSAMPARLASVPLVIDEDCHVPPAAAHHHGKGLLSREAVPQQVEESIILAE
jgi:hypothetical protein